MPTPSSLSRLAWPSLPPLPMPAFLAAMDAPRRNLTLALAASLLLHASVLAIRFTPPIFNWLLFGYGLPALAFGLSARLMRRSSNPMPCAWQISSISP